MKYRIYIVMFIITLIVIYALDFTKNHRIREVKNISYKDAKNTIDNRYLNHINLKNDNSNSNILYTIVKIEIDKTNSSILDLAVKEGSTFYVFQNHHLTYSKDQRQYYKSFSNQTDYYNVIDVKLWQEKKIHRIPLHSHDPLYILIQRDPNHTISRLLAFPRIIQKDIQNLVATNLPIIKINTHSNSLDTSRYQFASTDFIFNQLSYSSFSKIKIRGNSSVVAPKKKFNIIFREENNVDGFTLKKNVLISSHIDRSFIRNKLADNLFSQFVGREPSIMYTHLIINDFYEGLYLLAEHPEQQFQKLTHHIDTSCFLLQIDRGPFDFYGNASQLGYKCEYPDNLPSNITNILDWFEHNINIQYNWFEHNTVPSATHPTDPFNMRVDYIVNRFGLSTQDSKHVVEKADYIMGHSNHTWIQSIKEKAINAGNTFYEQALEDANWLINQDNVKENILKFEDHSIDIGSFIDLIILNEFSKNIDGYRLSTYLSYIDNRFSVDMIWDFDLAWGLSKDNNGFDYEGFVISGEMSQFLPPFWIELWNNTVFQEKIKKRYIELRLSILSDKEIEKNINMIYSHITPSINENFERWKIINEDIWPNKFHFSSHEGEVLYLKEWILKRLEWLDMQWNN